MEFSYVYHKYEPQQVKFFLKEQGISKRLLAKIKFQGGQIFVNDQVENVLYPLKTKDTVRVIIPDEGSHETLLPDETPIDIVFEDEHLLVVNKPAGVPSIPAQYHPNKTMANRVKSYYQKQDYKDQVVHVVTRLDRDTSGLMLFAKHGFSHALLDKQLANKQLGKKYQAIISGDLTKLRSHDTIDLPILRDLTSIIKRQTGDGGKPAKTEYWLKQENETHALVDVCLHTGRTHQIRVHFAAIGFPLVGDELYGGTTSLSLKRQALHCRELTFTHPFTQEKLCFKQNLPSDMKKIM
ncbi:RluA family pseudouridine synthase [Tetragenococcus osmophilus]|uniref:Pseudouridine synthase n=1 Tax=Tetragenococcus osmophilus TaxID=526944 RepID=A0AA38CYZ4_9ENTE|nr:RluA family pseudouridine synthase [Tetragenococcus osmophilus]AYW48125.1 RluA family pseudouridine synthase [Tetragenococcus osmophilus]GMA53883.1 pseudouridine synthase [Alicyclobacillus contaminans]GMA72207.1 pseudouridine synthase [Tetragenococcus osmophilus]